MTFSQRMAAALYPPIGAVPATVPDRAGSNDGTNIGAKVAMVNGWSGLDFGDQESDRRVSVTGVILNGGTYTYEALVDVRNSSNSEYLFDVRPGSDGRRIIVASNTQFFDGAAFRGSSSDISSEGLVRLSIVADGPAEATRAYIDGVLLWEDDYSPETCGSDGTSPAAIGSRGGTVGGSIVNQSFMPLKSDFRLWDVARTQSEIQADMHKRLTGNEPGLVGYWPMQYGAHQ